MTKGLGMSAAVDGYVMAPSRLPMLSIAWVAGFSTRPSRSTGSVSPSKRRIARGWPSGRTKSRSATGHCSLVRCARRL